MIQQGPPIGPPALGPVRPRERDVIIQAVSAGVTPPTGVHLLQVGRSRELEALTHDLERVANGGSAVRFLTADYGGGKSFTESLLRWLARQRRMVTTNVDLTADRRLAGRDGYARNFYRELTANLATRAQPDGGALRTILERFVRDSEEAAHRAGVKPGEVVDQRLAPLTEMPHGYDFAAAVRAFWRGHDEGDNRLCSDADRWLRGEFDSRSDARSALGVRSIIDDTSVYPTVKLLAALCRLAGFPGLLVCVDELVALYRLGNTHARE